MSTIICLHSSASSPRQWRQLQQDLQGYRHCLAPPLYGYAANVSEFDPRHSIETELAAIDDALADAGPQIDLVGHSLGGALALEFARRYPNRIRSLVLYEPVVMPLLFADGVRRSVALEAWDLAANVRQAVAGKQFRRAAEVFVDYWSGRGTWHFMPHALQSAISARMPKVASEFQAIFASARKTGDFRHVNCPTLIMRGTASPVPVGVIADLLRRSLPGSRLLTLQGLGHMGPVSNPERVNLHIIEHLERAGASDLAYAA